MEITHDVTIDLLRPRQNVIRVVQEDSTRTIRLKLLSNNQNYNVADDLDEGETLLKFVEFRKSDGHGGMYDTTSTGETAVELEDSSVPNVWLVNLDGQCFTAPGWTQINVRFETESGKRIHTFAIMVDVEPTASSDTESTDWGNLNSIADLRNAVSAMFEETMSVEAKQALLNLLAHVAYVDEHGQDYYNALEAELFRTAEIVSISAVFDQGSATIYDTDSLDTLRQYLTVTAIYEDMSEREIITYTLSGTLTVGTSTITVSYGGKTATFDVVVSEAPLLPAEYQQVEYIESQLSGTTGPSISTGINPNALSHVKIRMAAVGAQSGKNFFGTSDAASGASDTFGIISFNSAHKIGFFVFGASVQAIAYDTDFHDYEMSASGVFVDGNEYTLSGTVSPVTLNNSLNLFQFANGNIRASLAVKYGIVEIDGKKYIPCYRKADGEIGMYEVSERVFKTNEGSGSFAKGADVE